MMHAWHSSRLSSRSSVTLHLPGTSQTTPVRLSRLSLMICALSIYPECFSQAFGWSWHYPSTGSLGSVY